MSGQFTRFISIAQHQMSQLIGKTRKSTALALLTLLALPSFGLAVTTLAGDENLLANITNLPLPEMPDMSQKMADFLSNRKEYAVQIPSDKYEPRKTKNQPLLVLHETTTSGRKALSMVKLPHYKASFHVLVMRDGTMVYMVPPDMTAYTAGVSQFRGEYDLAMTGRRTVNHFAYQIEMESPADGYWCSESPGVRAGVCVDGGGRGKTHSGYTEQQYMAVAWLAKRTGVQPSRITTHHAVDLSGTRSDPRSFNWDRFWEYYRATEISDAGQRISILPQPVYSSVNPEPPQE